MSCLSQEYDTNHSARLSIEPTPFCSKVGCYDNELSADCIKRVDANTKIKLIYALDLFRKIDNVKNVIKFLKVLKKFQFLNCFYSLKAVNFQLSFFSILLNVFLIFGSTECLR